MHISFVIFFAQVTFADAEINLNNVSSQ
jgi:hypothetical protein